MYFSKIKNISIALSLMLTPIAGVAAGLGQMNVNSGIGEPFSATIELLSATPTELKTLIANLASEGLYFAQGMQKAAEHNIKIKIANGTNGKKILTLSSRQPVAEPFVEILVALEWANGRVVRKYTALLDLPEYKHQITKVQTPLTNSFSNATLQKRTKRIGSSAAPTIRAPRAVSSEDHLTRRGDTLSKIARRMKPDGVSLGRMLVALFETNPEAFSGNNMNRLKVGKILQAPSAQALNAVSRKRAVKEIKLQTADWNQYRNRLIGVVAEQAPQESSEDGQATGGKIKSAAEGKSAPKSEMAKDVVKLSTGDATNVDASMQAKLTALQEEVTAREKSLAEAESRTAALEKQIADMQALLALKSDSMTAVQDNAAQAADVAVTTAETEVETVEKPTVTAEAQKPVEVKAPEPTAPTKPAPVAKEPSFMSGLLTPVLDFFSNVKGMFQQMDSTVLGGAGGLLLLAGGWLFYRNKQSQKLEDLEQGIMTSGSLEANTVFGYTKSNDNNTGDTSFVSDFSHFLTDFSQAFTNQLVTASDVDPIAEAEVYMAYGRDKQAEEILKDAIAKEPQRYELHHKLLEMYVANQNAPAFEAIANDMFATLGKDDPVWAKVAEMGRGLDSENQRYQMIESAKGGGNSIATTTEAAVAATANFAEEVVDDEVLDTEGPIEYNIDGPSPTETPAPVSVETSELPKLTEEETPVTDLGETLADELAPMAEEVEAVAETPMGIEEAAPDFDFTTLELATPDTFAETSVENDMLDDEGEESFEFPEVPKMDMPDISLDLADETPVASAPVATLAESQPAIEDVETKLELVAAYINMEDKEGAKELLVEVLKEGDLSQRKRADEMIASLT